ncbi:MAG: hypothetical protein IH900_04830 [Proteobacteria bacterium]|nr:hypothetical protein [Pseudomonadota bacterium]
MAANATLERPSAATEGAGPVLEAAAALEVREFDLFALAHRWWFGRGADARVRPGACPMSCIARGFPATRPMARRIACPISMGYYQRSLV